MAGNTHSKRSPTSCTSPVMWLSLLLEAEQGIDVLAFSGTFFAQSNPRIATMPAQLAASG